MLKKIVQLWKKQGVMIKAVETFGQMLDDCGYVFNESWHVFTGVAGIDEHKDRIRERDIAVNKAEREIRRLLVEHLTINPGQDVSGCLALMTMSKDAERIGDYAKNIFDLASLLGESRTNLRHLDQILEIRDRISTNMTHLKQAFLDSDEKAAHQILENYTSIKADINGLLHGLFTEELPTMEALGTVLLLRYLKRINSHVSNVASGIIFPIDKIDFVRGGLLE
ncbi:MAG: hypothetical protein GF331_01310 [Chitinivibrionales bacterium]|nr:hypothetical protein [Chitinivibrionales bacterium]